MLLFAAYICTATPCCNRASPLPAMVIRPSMKSLGLAGKAKGFQRRRLGEATASPQGAGGIRPVPICRYGGCSGEGGRRYWQGRRVSWRGAGEAAAEAGPAV